MKTPASNRIGLPAVLGLLIASLSAVAVGGEVYQWKDARGVTHYSSTPPARGNYKTRTIQHKGGAAGAVANAGPTDNPQCVAARQRVELLQGKGPLQLDIDGDGKGDKPLPDNDRPAQLALAHTMLANCAVPATAARK